MDAVNHKEHVALAMAVVVLLFGSASGDAVVMLCMSILGLSSLFQIYRSNPSTLRHGAIVAAMAGFIAVILIVLLQLSR
jgi:hypothetical protein